MMKAAVLQALWEAPSYEGFAEPVVPTAFCLPVPDAVDPVVAAVPRPRATT